MSFENVRKYINEATKSKGDMVFWHGGNLDVYDDVVAQKNGRYEYGPGLYATTSYNVVMKYKKGGRKLYQLTIARGNDLNDVYLDIEKLNSFVDKFVTVKYRKEIKDAMLKYKRKDGKVPVYVFQNNIINRKAIKPSNTKDLRMFLVDNGIDYELINNASGYGETMIVLFNMKKIVNVKRITPKDKIEDYELPPIE